ncbi:MAG: hypothetical protein HYV07_28890 [Deltaproteobacteria bacterium]|nr:hypothetical protein [Deltaproteobacteria bacterium]
MSQDSRLATRGAHAARLGVLLPLALLVVRPAEATVVKALSLEEKTQASSLVVYGRVADVVSAWEKPGAKIKTLVTFEVAETLKGKAKKGDKVVVRRAGGRIGDKEHRVEGVSRFEPGELAVLFLEPLAGEYVEVGVGIGKYDVRAKDGETYVRFEPTVGELSGSHVTPAASMPAVRLASFLERVRSYAGPKAPMSEPTKFRPILNAPVHRRSTAAAEGR